MYRLYTSAKTYIVSYNYETLQMSSVVTESQKYSLSVSKFSDQRFARVSHFAHMYYTPDINPPSDDHPKDIQCAEA